MEQGTSQIKCLDSFNFS